MAIRKPHLKIWRQANALNIDLILVEESIEGLFTIETVLSNCQDCKRTPLLLHKRPDHYNAIVPFSIEPFWQHGLAHVNGVLNSDNADDKPNALLSNPTPLDESSNPTPLDEASYLDDGHTDDVQLLIRNKSDDSSMLSSNGDDTEDSTEDFIYRLRMHRKSNPTYLIAGFLNINSIRNKFSPVQHILRNSNVDLLGVSEIKLNDTFLMVNFMLIIMY